ncbi:transcription elongation factor A N-terminal and central domain-containing protein [Micropterus salmoides]|uniref:transcription elongation factor A N-terminal and central domain-containing protein n=1 Tax=Micropterus salmoides TaxID=27706 RepID=UPI0018EC5CCC|nr:transcription elongation factor A N-terminal and central domain-containing protein [Micropterus salmoides]
MDVKEIVHCALQIEKCCADRSYGNILTLLSDLDKLHVTAEQLEATDVVKVLYRLLKTCSDDGVKKTAKSLLSKWKRQYSKDTQGVKCTEESKDPKLSWVSVPDKAGDGGVSRQGDSHSGSAQTCDSKVKCVKCADEEASSSCAKDELQTLSVTAESASASCSFSSVRSKCVQLLLTALIPELSDKDKAAELARDIEEQIHELHKSSQVKFKACVRSKVANLRNPKNKHLRQGLLSGLLSPEAFARMSAEEMASAELRQLRKEYSSRGVSERQLPEGVEGTQTQKIRCKRCGGSDCRVTQVSRGALFLPAWVRQGGPDEDALTFVTCSTCGQQWYHSGWVCL